MSDSHRTGTGGADDGPGAATPQVDVARGTAVARVPVPALRERRPGPDAALVAVVVVVLVALPVVLALVSAATHPGLPKGDFAIIEMRALDVPGHLPLTGMYSRYGFDHPGPALFYLAAVPLRLFGPVGLQVTAALVNLGAAIGALVVLRRRGGQALALVGAGVLLLLFRALQIEVVSIWNPWVPIVPLFLAIVLTWSVWCRDSWALPWLAGVVTFMVQAHVGFAPTGAFLLGSSAGWAAWCALRARQARRATPEAVDEERIGRPLGLAAAVAVVLWLPPVIDELVHRPGNLSAIWDFVRTGQPGESKVGLGKGLTLLSQVVGIDGTFFRGITRFALSPLEGGSVWRLVLVLVPFVAAAVLAARRGADDAVRLAALVGGLLVVGWLSLAQITGLPYVYVVQWLVAVGAVLWLSTIWSVLSAFVPSVRDWSVLPVKDAPDGSASARVLVPAAAVAVSLVVLAGVATAATVRSPGDGYLGDAVVEQFAQPAFDAAYGGGVVLVSAAPPNATNGAWSLETSAIATGVQAELRRRGLDAVTDDDREILVGPDGVVGDRTVGLRLVISADTSVTPAPDPATTLAVVDNLSLTDRREYQALDRKGGTDPPTPLAGSDLARWGYLRSQAVVYTLTVTPP